MLHLKSYFVVIKGGQSWAS